MTVRIAVAGRLALFHHGNRILPSTRASHGHRDDPSRRPSSAVVLDPLCSGPDRDRVRYSARALLSGPWQADEAPRRRLHRADQDDDRADHFLHRRPRHFVDGRSEACRARRPESAGLFRDGLDGGVGDRPDRRQSPAARPRLQHRSGLDRSEIRRHLRHQGKGGGHRLASPRHYPRQLFRCARRTAICCRCC